MAPASGVEVVVTELARRMAALGHEVTCYDRSGSDVMTGDAWRAASARSTACASSP